MDRQETVDESGEGCVILRSDLRDTFDRTASCNIRKSQFIRQNKQPLQAVVRQRLTRATGCTCTNSATLPQAELQLNNY